MPNPIGYPWIELQSIDSTNNYATAKVHEGMAQHGMAVFAQHQTKGKGQRNKVWKAAEGQNIILSIVVEPAALTLSQSFIFSMAIAFGTLQFFNRYALNDTTIKWPNDIYWRDRKAGGILIENILQGADWKYAIAGVGLNINQTDFGELGTKAVSLKQITGVTYNSIELAKELCGCLQGVYERLLANPQSIMEIYQAHLYKRNDNVKFRKGNRLFEGTVKGVTAQGQLFIHHAVEGLFSVGELEWIV